MFIPDFRVIQEILRKSTKNKTVRDTSAITDTA